MRTLPELSSHPHTLRPSGKGGRAHTANLERAPGNRRFPDHWREADVRGVLRAHQGPVCAYCGTELGPNDPGDVDHFRPKARVEEDTEHPGYWWLAYDSRNLFLSCRICNSSRKGSKFPLREGSPRVHGPDDPSVEDPVLFDPRLDDPDARWSVALGEDGHVVGTLSGDDRANTVARFFDLNRTALVRDRIKAIDAWRERIDQADRDGATRMAMAHMPHSSVARSLLVRAGLAPPDPESTLSHRFEQVLGELDLARRLSEAAAPSDGEQDRRRAEIVALLWEVAALAVRAGDALDARIVETGLSDAVSAPRAQLTSAP